MRFDVQRTAELVNAAWWWLTASGMIAAAAVGYCVGFLCRIRQAFKLFARFPAQQSAAEREAGKR